MQRPRMGDPNDDLNFQFVAKDARGKRGVNDLEVSFNDADDGVRVRSRRIIHKPGDPINVSIESTTKQGTVYVDVVRGWTVVESRFAMLKDGRAELQIPYAGAFKGELKISAFVEGSEGEDNDSRSTIGVIYPTKHGITVDASFDKTVYKPNDEATVSFGIVDIVGRAVESALGVVVL